MADQLPLQKCKNLNEFIMVRDYAFVVKEIKGYPVAGSTDYTYNGKLVAAIVRECSREGRGIERIWGKNGAL